MVPEDRLDGAALSAPEPVDQSTQPDEPEVAESAEGPHSSEARYKWADLSEGVVDPTVAASLEPQANPEPASEPIVGDLLSGEGAASGALGEASSEESPKFDALSLQDPVKQEDPEEVTAEKTL